MTNPRDQAIATWSALRDQFYDPRHALYGNRRFLWPRDYEALWPFACAWSAQCSLAFLEDSGDAGATLAEPLRGVTAYHRRHEGIINEAGTLGFESMVVPPLGAGGERYYDDNAWIALALLHNHSVLGDESLLLLARRCFEFVSSGWSSDLGWAIPGGIRWKEPATNRSRHTCSNGPAIEVAAQLYARTGEQHFLEWASRGYRWEREALLQRDDLYADRLDPDGTVHQEIWSYNQGTMIGAGVLLHQMTGDADYLDHALATAASAIRRFTPEALSRQLPAFNAIFFRNALLLPPGRIVGAMLDRAQAYSALMWDQLRDDRRGLFLGTGPPLNHNTPMAQIYALLAGSPPHP